ncbi:MAG: hypothetical protein KAJ12_11335, partial [Bacteroidetes bacterium]|nr:hypothetical protein [Bacteroidota bacterium]
MGRAIRIASTLLLLLPSIAASQDRMSVSLAAAIDSLESDAIIRAVVALESRLDLMTLNQALDATGVPAAHRASPVIRHLQQHAQRTQADILDYLKSKPPSEVRNHTAFWIANVIVVDATPGVLLQLSRRSDVA